VLCAVATSMVEQVECRLRRRRHRRHREV